MRRENLHLTLVFLGAVARENIAQVVALGEQQNGGRFKLEFGTAGYWRHNRIVWAAPTSTPAPLRELVATLELALRNAGTPFDRRPYAPHITLLRDARKPPTAPMPEFDWHVNEFTLLESARGADVAQYRVLARWPLHA